MGIRHSTREASTPIGDVVPYGHNIIRRILGELASGRLILTELLSNERAEAIATDDYSPSELAVILGE